MFSFNKKLFLIILSYFIVTNSVLAEPINIEQIKQNLLAYHESGGYNRDVTKIINKAQHFLGKEIQNNQRSDKPKRLAIVLDIDETSLSNYESLKKNDLCSGEKQLDEEMSATNDPAIKPTLGFYRFAIENKVTVFFITGRPEKYRKTTIKNLHKAGYKKWSKLFLRPQDYHKSSAIPFKSGKRKYIQSLGYTIVVNVGDQWSDLKGGYALKTFKLPNPFYYVI